METLSATQQIQQRPQQVVRCTGSRQEQIPLCPAGFTANGFLNHQFLPLYEQGREIPGKAFAETKLLASLAILEKAYPLTVLDVNDKPYPYNILLAHWDAERQIRNLCKDTEIFITQDTNQDFNFAVRETLNTGMHLYYIPLLPLHRLIESGRNKRSAELLLSVCAYLYHIAGIPHFRDEESYLHYHYKMLTEDLDPAWSGLDKEDIDLTRSALNSASYLGDKMQRRIHNPCHLQQLESRVLAGKPLTSFHRDCLRVAGDALSLWQTYPNAHLCRNVDDACLSGSEDEEDDYYGEEDNCIAIHEYVHFVAEIKGGIYNSLCEMVNCEFREKMYTQEPAVITRFDETLTGDKGSLDYERRLFKLINDLTEILDELP